jgi:hypothetical protein
MQGIRIKGAWPAAAGTVVAVALAFAAGAGAEMIGLYRNPMETTSQRTDMVKLSGASCARGGSDHAFRVVIGKRTKECAYRTPVVGRDLQVAATMRLLSNTPKSLQSKAFLALDLRAGGGARYQLAVYPLQRKTQLRKILAGGKIEYLQIEKNVATVKGLDKANKLQMSAVNITSGPDKGGARILASVGAEQVGDVTDRAAGELQGRASGFAVGAAKNANGIVASAYDLFVRGPNPF